MWKRWLAQGFRSTFVTRIEKETEKTTQICINTERNWMPELQLYVCDNNNRKQVSESNIYDNSKWYEARKSGNEWKKGQCHGQHNCCAEKRWIYILLNMWRYDVSMEHRHSFWWIQNTGDV